MKYRKIRDMKVGGKLFLSFGIIMLLYVVTVLVALSSIGKVANTLDDFYDTPFQNNNATLNMRAGIQGVGRNSLFMAMSRDEDKETYLSTIQDFHAMVDNGREVLRENHPNTSKVQQLDEYLNKMEPVWAQVYEALEQGHEEKVLELYGPEYEKNARMARQCLIEIEKESVERAQQYLDKGHQTRENMILIIVALAAVILSISTIMWYIITKSITRPVEAVQKAAKQLAAGALDAQVPYFSRDELGNLADSVRETLRSMKLYISDIERGMQAIGSGKLNYRTTVDYKGDFAAIKNSMNDITVMLNQALTQISNSADQVAGGAEQVANGAQMLSQGAVEQAGSMEELAANINEISDSVKNNAEDAVNASRRADQVSVMVAEGSAQMENMTSAIMEIKENSRAITGIVKEIEDIAFQTNILALNASVEAARAGEAGRGFSVVADEVRHLAYKASEAAKMMAHLAQQTTTKVDGGTLAVERAAESLKNIKAGAQEVTVMVDRISDASVSQADFIIQIRQSIEMISDIVQGNSATSEESAAASEELAAQAQLLKKLVEEFELL